MTLAPVIFVEDDDQLRLATTQALELAGFDVRAFARADDAAAISQDFAGIVVTDIRMPHMDGLELLAAVRLIDPEIPVVLITGHGDIAMAVRAMRDGAADFLTKPFATDHLIAAVRRSLAHRALVMDNRHLRALADAPAASEPLIGDSPPMQRLRQVIRQLAVADIDVLVEGETGTGKELVATMLHREGPRRARPLIAVNCGALPEGLAEIELFGHAADSVPQTRLSRTGHIASSSGGTLLLDEIDSMPLTMQARLLRVLEEREVHPIGAERPHAVDLRVVATSKIDLAEAVKAGSFRADLLYRLHTARIRVPPLRERGDDVVALFATFAGEAARLFGRQDWRIDAATQSRLRHHDWPGNVRELRNAATEAVLGTWTAGPDALAKPLAARVADYEAGEIRAALTSSRGRVAPVLATLGLPRKTLYDKMKRFGISPGDFK